MVPAGLASLFIAVDNLHADKFIRMPAEALSRCFVKRQNDTIDIHHKHRIRWRIQECPGCGLTLTQRFLCLPALGNVCQNTLHADNMVALQDGSTG